MVVVFVVDGKQAEILVGKIPATASTYPRMESQGPLAVTFQAILPGPAGSRHNLMHLLLVQLTTPRFIVILISIFRFEPFTRSRQEASLFELGALIIS